MQEHTEEDKAAGPKVRVVRRRRSMWEDRVVRSMAFWVGALIIVLLSAVLSALYFGLIGGNPAPRTALQRELMAWESVTSTLDEAATADQWQSFVLTLIADSQYQRAQGVIAQVDAQSKIDQTRGANMLYCTAVLQSARGRDDEALETFGKVMERTRVEYEKELASKDVDSPNWAKAVGLHDNHYFSALERAKILRDQEKWKEALEMLDVYLEERPQEAGVLVDRAYLKVQLGDRSGAESDYREALRFVPDFPEALEGLQEIGAGE